MRIIIAGGSGFLGSALTQQLVDGNHEVVVLTRQQPHSLPRQPGVTYVTWSPDGRGGPWATTLEGAGAIVNLSGESIAARRWSKKQKDKIRESRLAATRSLTTAIRGSRQPPAVLVSGSAVGYYGNRGEETLTEASAPGDDFLAEICRQWEAAASDVAHLTRVALIRTGVVLDRHGGALPKMLPPFLIFAGGPIGSGRQYMSWIHRDDWVRLVAWTITTEGVRGAVNATSPSPVTNNEFSKALGQALKRPSLLPAPGFALKLALGEMADALLLSSQRALPVRAADLGFPFLYGNIDEALADIFSGR
jgi:uncharacterized protein (TIGR01777 family)